MNERRLDKLLSKAAVQMRKIALGFTIVVAILTFFFVNYSRWANALTSFESILGVVSIWLTLEIFRIGLALSNQQNDILEGHNKLIKEVHRTVLISMKANHAQELRRKYDEATAAKDDFKIKYWHFFWRFETWTTMTISLKPKGFARIRVLGTNNPPLETDLEKFQNPIYTVDIYEIQENEELQRGRAFCWCFNGLLQISNNANEIELQSPFVTFEITGRIGEAGAVGHRPSNLPRLMDLIDPTDADRDLG